MLIIFFASRDSYDNCKTLIKAEHGLREYAAHDLSSMEQINIAKPMPIPIAYSKATDIILVPFSQHEGFLYAVLGILHALLPESHLLYIEDKDKYKDALYQCLSVHVENKDLEESNKLLRPIFFDILFKTSSRTKELNDYYNSNAQSFFSVASKLWQSHRLHLFLLFHKALIDDNQVISSFIQMLELFLQDTSREALSPQLLDYLGHIRRTLQLSSTEFKQLHILSKGAVEHIEEKKLIEKLEHLIAPFDIDELAPEAKKKMYLEYKELLLGVLH